MLLAFRFCLCCLLVSVVVSCSVLLDCFVFFVCSVCFAMFALFALPGWLVCLVLFVCLFVLCCFVLCLFSFVLCVCFVVLAWLLACLPFFLCVWFCFVLFVCCVLFVCLFVLLGLFCFLRVVSFCVVCVSSFVRLFVCLCVCLFAPTLGNRSTSLRHCQGVADSDRDLRCLDLSERQLAAQSGYEGVLKLGGPMQHNLNKVHQGHQLYFYQWKVVKDGPSISDNC